MPDFLDVAAKEESISLTSVFRLLYKILNASNKLVPNNEQVPAWAFLTVDIRALIPLVSLWAPTMEFHMLSFVIRCCDGMEGLPTHEKIFEVHALPWNTLMSSTKIQFITITKNLEFEISHDHQNSKM